MSYFENYPSGSINIAIVVIQKPIVLERKYDWDFSVTILNILDLKSSVSCEGN